MMEQQLTSQQSKLKVLYVDDNPLDLQIILNQLSDQFEFTFANSGQEALSYGFQQPQPDIFLIDIHMPNINGFELCEQFSKAPETSHIPIIFLTSNDTLNSKTRGFNIGCVDYVVKPIDPLELNLRINNHVKIARQSKIIDTLPAQESNTRFNNYFKYIQELQTEWDICKRYDYPLTLLHCEIDHLQDLLSPLDDEESSEVTLTVANAIRDIGNRPGDSVAHIGSATFAILLSDSQISHAVDCAKELVAKISALQIITRPKSLPIQVTISVGVASLYPEGNTAMMTIHENAHAALTEAILHGGNGWQMFSNSNILAT